MFFFKPSEEHRAVAKEYFDEHLSHNDYYTQGEVQRGQSVGEGVWKLGLHEGQERDQGTVHVSVRQP